MNKDLMWVCVIVRKVKDNQGKVIILVGKYLWEKNYFKLLRNNYKKIADIG